MLAFAFARRVLVLGVVVVGVLVFGVSSALAGSGVPFVVTGEGTPVGSTGATVNGIVDPEGTPVTSCMFEYGPEVSYGQSVECAQSVGEGSLPVAVSAELSGLEPGRTYHYRLVAGNENGLGEGLDGTFTMPVVAPTVGEVSASEVDSTSVTLGARVNADGAATSYRVEYGASEAYGSSTPEVSIGTPVEATGVQVHLHGLTPGVEYHYRFIVNSAAGGEHTADGTFKTAVPAPAPVAGLPDGRVYEMVSPPSDENAEVYTPIAAPEQDFSDGVDTARRFQVAVDGNAVAYQGDAAPSDGGEGNGGQALGSQYLARRSAGGGWTQASIQPPGYRGATYEGFSSNLSVGILETNGKNGESSSYGGLLSPEAPHTEVLYRRALGEDVYRPLFTTMPPNRPTTSFGTPGVRIRPTSGVLGILAFAGASADSSQSLFEADDALIAGAGSLERELQEDAEQEVQEGKEGNYLYDSADGRLGLVDVLPNGRVEPNATFGAQPFGNTESPAPDFNHVVSSDGSRVYWTAIGTSMVYVRVGGVSTVPVSVGPARFWVATGDGQYAFYTENEGLYRFDVEQPQARETLVGAGAGVEGVVGISENGEDIYFVATGVLAAGATPGQPNLYLEHDGGAVTFIATLSAADGTQIEPFNPDGSDRFDGAVIGDWAPSAGYRTAEVTSDGGSLVFMSNQPLKAKGFPNGYANEGREEVYVYDAGTGQLSCASCDQDGVPGSSGYVPPMWTPTYVPQWISQNGSKVFFDSGSALVPQDINGRQDVYEWEREGSGSCRQGTDGGCIYLLSNGVDSSASWLLGASANGSDAFIITRAGLVPQDDNGLFDVYDARVGGVPPAAPVACSGAACGGVPASVPGLVTPSSVTFDGVGNIMPVPAAPAVKVKVKRLSRAQLLATALKACRKRSGRARAVCVAGARRRYGPVGKAKKASRLAMKGRR